MSANKTAIAKAHVVQAMTDLEVHVGRHGGCEAIAGPALDRYYELVFYLDEAIRVWEHTMVVPRRPRGMNLRRSES